MSNGPAHQTFRAWAASRPSPSRFQIFTAWPGLAHQYFKGLGPARPGPAHHIFKILRPGRPGPSQFSDRPSPYWPRQTVYDKPCEYLAYMFFRLLLLTNPLPLMYLTCHHGVRRRHHFIEHDSHSAIPFRSQPQKSGTRTSDNL